MVSLSAVVCLAVLAVATATNVDQCPDSRKIADLTNLVQLPSCQKIPCKLKRGSNQHVIIKFTPDSNVNEVVSDVKAEVFGVPLPFVGVDGQSVCNKIFTDDDVQASCPLKAGTTYVYKDSFPVLDLYPKITTTVRWALKNKGKDLICFKVNARIV